MRHLPMTNTKSDAKAMGMITLLRILSFIIIACSAPTMGCQPSAAIGKTEESTSVPGPASPHDDGSDDGSVADCSWAWAGTGTPGCRLSLDNRPAGTPSTSGEFSYQLTKWRSDHRGAVTISIDDFPLNAATYAAPALERYGFRGSFNQVSRQVGAAEQSDNGFGVGVKAFMSDKPGDVRVFPLRVPGGRNPSWEILRALHRRGHEIASHSATHVSLDAAWRAQAHPADPVDWRLEWAASRRPIRTWGELPLNFEAETRGSKEDLEAGIDGLDVVSIVGPHNGFDDESTETLQEYGYLTFRAGAPDGNGINPPDYCFRVSVCEICFGAAEGSCDTDAAGYNRCADFAEDEGGWAIEMFHDIAPKEEPIRRNDNVTLSEFEDHIRYVSGKNLWVSTQGSTAKFLMERAAASIRRYEARPTELSLWIDDGLDDALFDEPITLRLFVPAGWGDCGVSVSQGGATERASVENGQLLLDVLPDGREIRLTPSSGCGS